MSRLSTGVWYRHRIGQTGMAQTPAQVIQDVAWDVDRERLNLHGGASTGCVGRAMSRWLSRLNTGGSAAALLQVSAPIWCKEGSVRDANPCPYPLTLTNDAL